MALDCPVVATEAGAGESLGDVGTVVADAPEHDLGERLAAAVEEALTRDPDREVPAGRAWIETRHGLPAFELAHARVWDRLVPDISPSRTVHLLWLESTASGSAAALHLAGTRRRLAAAGLVTGLVLTDDRPTERTTTGRVARLGRLVLRGRAAARPGTLLVRHHPLAAPVVRAWLRRGARVVISVQGALTDARTDGGPWARVLPVDRMTRWQLSRAAALVTVTEGLAEQLREATGGKVPVSVIPNGIEDPGRVRPMPAPRAYACFAGNLAPWQGIASMLAATRAAGWPDEVDLVVIGDGRLRAEVEAAADDRVRVLGPLSHGETQRWLAGAVCTFSLKDPAHPAGAGGYWPFKVLEAAALGVPIVLSDAPGLPEMSEALGHAVVCAYGDADAVARAVAVLAGDREHRGRLAVAGRRNVSQFFWEAGAEDLAALLRPGASGQ
jgi:glycosyltransferase involved in cell wall biosynthesis